MATILFQPPLAIEIFFGQHAVQFWDHTTLEAEICNFEILILNLPESFQYKFFLAERNNE